MWYAYLASITTDTRPVLTNAISFLGKWVRPFDVKSTLPRAFTTAGDQKVKVPTPFADFNYLDYLENTRLQAVRLQDEVNDKGFKQEDKLMVQLPKFE